MVPAQPCTFALCVCVLCYVSMEYMICVHVLRVCMYVPTW